jgi:hypothetical protein
MRTPFRRLLLCSILVAGCTATDDDGTDPVGRHDDDDGDCGGDADAAPPITDDAGTGGWPDAGPPPGGEADAGPPIPHD